MKEKTLVEKLDRAKIQVKNAVDELRTYEEMLEAEGYCVEKLNQEELLQLIDKKACTFDREISEVALHVVAAGRCAGSYGCG